MDLVVRKVRLALDGAVETRALRRVCRELTRGKAQGE